MTGPNRCGGHFACVLLSARSERLARSLRAVNEQTLMLIHRIWQGMTPVLERKIKPTIQPVFIYEKLS